jgi:uncharacterized membrane protein
MGRITVTKTIKAPVEVVFGYVDDHHNTTRYMKDLTKWQPAGGQTHGKGSRFDVAMKAGPTHLDSSVEITSWTENQEIGWESRKGFKQTGTWRFKAVAGATQATFDMEYEFPGGIAGKLLARAAEPIVKGNIEKSVEALKLQTEKLAPAPAPTRESRSARRAPAAPSAHKSANKR